MKKTSLLLLFACAILLSQAQELKYTVKGKTDVKPNNGEIKLYRYDLANSSRVDSVKINPQGEFKFTGSVPDAQPGQIIFHVGEETYSEVFYLESGLIKIDIKKGKRYPVLSGTPLNKDFNDYYEMMDHLLDSANATYRPARSYDQFSSELKTEKLHLMQQFVPQHPNSLLSLYEMNIHVANSGNTTRLATLYAELTPEVRRTKEGKDMASLITGLSSNKIGDIALDFSMPDTTGKMVKLTDFRGKYVLLDFWATWCGPCLEEMPNVVNAYQKYRGKNFTIVGVSLDRPHTKVLWEKNDKRK